MLMLLFSLGNSQYAIPARDVIEVAPLLRLEAIAKAPGYIAGLFNYRGTHVPVIDLCQLLIGRPCEPSFTSRIILVDFTTPYGETHPLGLLAEQVTETLSIDPAVFSDTGVEIDDAPYLGDATHIDGRLVQRIQVSSLLPAPVQAQLFAAETA